MFLEVKTQFSKQAGEYFFVQNVFLLKCLCVVSLTLRSFYRPSLFLFSFEFLWEYNVSYLAYIHTYIMSAIWLILYFRCGMLLS